MSRQGTREWVASIVFHCHPGRTRRLFMEWDSGKPIREGTSQPIVTADKGPTAGLEVNPFFLGEALPVVPQRIVNYVDTDSSKII